MRPDYEVMVFEASEYVAGCPFVENQVVEFDFDCTSEGDETLFKFGYQTSTDGSYYVGNSSTNGSDWSGAQGQVYVTSNSKDTGIYYGFFGPINDSNHGSGKEYPTNGQWLSIHGTSVPTDAVLGGTASGGYTYCDCKFISDSAYANAHHHIHGWTHISGSRNQS